VDLAIGAIRAKPHISSLKCLKIAKIPLYHVGQYRCVRAFGARSTKTRDMIYAQNV
jgi:hypothetical protein